MEEGISEIHGSTNKRPTDGNCLCLSCVQLTCLAHLDSVHRNAAASWLKNARAGTTAVPTFTTFFQTNSQDTKSVR